MRRNPLHRLLLTFVPACLTLVACGGGGSSGGSESVGYVTASSSSFSPTTAKDKATRSQDVPLRWVYAVNNGQPVTASLGTLSMGVAVDAVEVKIDPANLRRQVNLQGAVSGTFEGTAFSGNYSAALGEGLMFSAGKTVITNQATEVNLSLTGGGESATAKLTARLGSFVPPYEWLPDRENLDQLPVGRVETVSSNGAVDLNIAVTDEAPIVRSNQPVSVSDRWTVLEKLTTMTVRGTSYANVVKLSRQTQVPDFSGNLTTVTIYYWVAKGVGMIRGEGVYRILSADNVVYELTETNLSQL